MAAGTMHATKTDVNAEHIKKQTKKFKEMTMKVGNTFLLNELSLGDLKTNELYYHHCCYTNLVRECEAIDADTSIIDTNWLKAATFDNILSHIINAEVENPGSTFSARALKSMYVDQLKAKWIKESINTFQNKTC